MRRSCAVIIMIEYKRDCMYILSFDVGIRNLAYSVLYRPDYPQDSQGLKSKKKQSKTLNQVQVIDCNIINLKKDDEKGAKSVSVETIAKRLLEKLYETFVFGAPVEYYDVVLIENQPSFLNPTMKAISTMIYTFFMIQTLENEEKSQVKYISPRKKLKVADKGDASGAPQNGVITAIPPGSRHSKNKYNERKKRAIEYARHYLKDVIQDPKALAKFEAHAKKDDCADALLFGIYYLETH